MASFEYAGVMDKLSGDNEKYKAALLASGEAMKEAIAILDAPDFASREGWKKETENGDDHVFSKAYGQTKLFALSAELPINCEVFFQDCWENIDTLADWNPNFDFSKIVARLTPNADVVHYGNRDIMIIKGRDFVAARMKRKIGNKFLLACRSFDCETIPETKEKVRAHLHLGAGRFAPHPSDPNRTCFDYIMSIDFKGMIPKSIVNQAMGRLVLAEAEVNRKHVLELVAKKTDGRG